MRILNYGSLNIDYVYQVDHIVLPGETIHGRSFETFPGGKGANQSAAIAKAGGRVWHAGKVGSDAGWLLETLNGFGVNTDLVRRSQGPSGHALIQVSADGENSIVLYGGGNQQISREEIDQTLGEFGAEDVLVLQNEISHIPYILERAISIGMRVVLNPAPYTEEISQWPLEQVATLVVNETEAAGIMGSAVSPEKTLDQLTSRYPDTEIVLTLGTAGAWYASGAERFYTPSLKVEAVDTTAAGDTFFGYYLVDRINDASPEEAMKTATAAAAITVSKLGAMKSIPYRDELGRS